MLTTRVIPCLLLQNETLVKTIRFADPTYVGDPTNVVRIYNEKHVDELVVLDITATASAKAPPFAVIEMLASECFMPVAYGGGLSRMADLKQIFRLGIEKVIINSAAVDFPDFIREASDHFGSQAIVVSIDAKRKAAGGWETFTHGGRRNTGLTPRECAAQAQERGAGEILLTSIDRDGTMTGYDLELIREVTTAVDVPVIACGGAGKVSDFGLAVNEGGAAAVAAGSMVVYFGRNRAVLIGFPGSLELSQVFQGSLARPV